MTVRKVLSLQSDTIASNGINSLLYPGNAAYAYSTADWVKLFIQWDRLQPYGPPSSPYDTWSALDADPSVWDHMDRQIKQARDLGKGVILTVAPYVPQWAWTSLPAPVDANHTKWPADVGTESPYWALRSFEWIG